MKWNNLWSRFRYLLQYFPFTINAVVLSLAFWACMRILKPAEAAAKGNFSSFRPLILLIGRTALWFVAGLVAFSVLSALVCWLHYLILQRKRGYDMDMSFRPPAKGKGLWLEAWLYKARRPFLGFIKGRLLYDGRHMTDKFILASNRRRPQQFWRDAVAGKSLLELNDIKEYAISGGFIYFEDMLQLFSLPVRQRVKGHFYQAPETVAQDMREALPRKTEQTDTRIEQLRRVEGEYLNYKDFESGDDVRRIVWKVYAKSRELVVRVPEIFDPYASHVYFYASFHAGIRAGGQNPFVAEMLNHYKNRVWTAYQVLTTREWQVKYIPDQPLNIPGQSDVTATVQRSISSSSWQQDRALQDYFEPRYGAVLCISSFNDPQEVARMLELCSADTVIYYVKLSRTFRDFMAWSWLKRIFLLSPDDRLKRIRSRWILSPLRFQLQKREKAIEAALRNSEANIAHL